MVNKKILRSVLLLILISVLVSSLAQAQLLNRGLNSIENFFRGGYTRYTKILDFSALFLILTAAFLIALRQIKVPGGKDGKETNNRPIKVLAVVLALTSALGIVTTTKFSIFTYPQIWAALAFIVLVWIIYTLLLRMGMENHKFWAFILALIIATLLVFLIDWWSGGRWLGYGRGGGFGGFNFGGFRFGGIDIGKPRIGPIGVPHPPPPPPPPPPPDPFDWGSVGKWGGIGLGAILILLLLFWLGRKAWRRFRNRAPQRHSRTVRKLLRIKTEFLTEIKRIILEKDRILTGTAVTTTAEVAVEESLTRAKQELINRHCIELQGIVSDPAFENTPAGLLKLTYFLQSFLVPATSVAVIVHFFQTYRSTHGTNVANFDVKTRTIIQITTDPHLPANLARFIHFQNELARLVTRFESKDSRAMQKIIDVTRNKPGALGSLSNQLTTLLTAIRAQCLALQAAITATRTAANAAPFVVDALKTAYITEKKAFHDLFDSISEQYKLIDEYDAATVTQLLDKLVHSVEGYEQSHLLIKSAGDDILHTRHAWVSAGGYHGSPTPNVSGEQIRKLTAHVRVAGNVLQHAEQIIRAINNHPAKNAMNPAQTTLFTTLEVRLANTLTLINTYKNTFVTKYNNAQLP